MTATAKNEHSSPNNFSGGAGREGRGAKDDDDKSNKNRQTDNNSRFVLFKYIIFYAFNHRSEA